MKCSICEKGLPDPPGTRTFAVWIENRLLPAGSTVCPRHRIRRACSLCLEPTGGEEDEMCRLCKTFAERGHVLRR